ncbi:DUF1697 domain-containing protein [Micrococcus porci]|uniref:DUF1697 domain-containing protein n=1 Tax=Micrococcus TaxID=1269 RepID=UPI001CCF0917|nr:MULTISPECIES: DUF1697 domain-containing protein [Micrococcus]MCG7421980.1 DUF1697 domain-containing protein [Micrococcus sp. ACRRV]UBH23779.1 DUF1697 domain-containing protein [Micrococcus porci]
MSRAAPRTDHTHVLLLRGINVGRSNRVSNARLAAWAEAARARDVTTHLASGNVLFRLPDADDDAGPAFLRAFRDAALADDGPDVPLILTTPAELRGALAMHDRLPWSGGEAKLTQLTVLAESPRDGAAEALAGLDHGSGRAAGPDRSALEGRFLWIRSPGRISDSPLTPARLEKALGVTGTARNLATVRVLAGMA